MLHDLRRLPIGLILNHHPEILADIFLDLLLNMFVLVQQVSKLISFSSLVHLPRQSVIEHRAFLNLDRVVLSGRISMIKSVIRIKSFNILIIKIIVIVFELPNRLQRFH